MSSFKCIRNTQKKVGGSDSSVPDNQFSKAKKKTYCNFVFQQRSLTMTDMNIHGCLESKPISFSDFYIELSIVRNINFIKLSIFISPQQFESHLT